MSAWPEYQNWNEVIHRRVPLRTWQHSRVGVVIKEALIFWWWWSQTSGGAANRKSHECAVLYNNVETLDGGTCNDSYPCHLNFLFVNRQVLHFKGEIKVQHANNKAISLHPSPHLNTHPNTHTHAHTRYLFMTLVKHFMLCLFFTFAFH